MMAKAMFGQPEQVNPDQSYKQFFGDLAITSDSFGGQSKEYWNVWTRVNKSTEILKNLAKDTSITTQTGGAGTAGTAMVPVTVDSQIVDRTVKETPLRVMIPRRACRGLTYDYIPLTAKGGAYFGLEGNALADVADTYTRVSVPIKFLYAKGRVTGPAIAAMRGFIDPQALDLQVKTASIAEKEESAIINGDLATTPEEFNGLIKLITTNTTNMSSTLPTLAQLRAEYTTSYNANGQVVVSVTDKTTHSYVKSLLFEVQRNVEPATGILSFGIPDAFVLDGVMWITDKFMPTGSNAKRVLNLDMRYLFMAVLQDLTYEEKASENDTYVYLLKEYLALVLTHEASCTMMYGIS